MTNLRYQHLLANVRDLENHTEAADRLRDQILKSNALRDELAAHAIFDQLDARIKACKILSTQIAAQIPQIAEVSYD